MPCLTIPWKDIAQHAVKWHGTYPLLWQSSFVIDKTKDEPPWETKPPSSRSQTGGPRDAFRRAHGR